VKQENGRAPPHHPREEKGKVQLVRSGQDVDVRLPERRLSELGQREGLVQQMKQKLVKLIAVRETLPECGQQRLQRRAAPPRNAPGHHHRQ
jgi:hypothetical protein